MSEEHGTFERLVVGHVLGDLPDADASRFRSHLLGCRDCRSRVAELRGIAADLADAERDELARGRVRTEAPRRLEDVDPAPGRMGRRITVRHVTIAALLVMVMAAAMGFWNLHLRAGSAVYLAVAEDRSETLAVLATGRALELDLAPGLGGIAATDGERVAVSLSGLGEPADGELLVAWFLGGPGGTAPIALAGNGQLDDGRLATTIADPGATELLITRERSPGEGPAGPQLLRTALLEPS